MTLYYALLPVALLLMIFYFFKKRKTEKLRIAQQQAAEKKQAEGNVRCFTCGIYVPIETALEKKGRYFCGVKKQDRFPSNM